jgi:hypothetical protein
MEAEIEVELEIEREQERGGVERGDGGGREGRR